MWVKPAARRGRARLFIQQAGFPPAAAVVKPVAADQPRVRHFIYVGAPPPKRHTLDVGPHRDVWFGTVPNQLLRIAVAPRLSIGAIGIKGDGPKEVGREWDIDSSLWRPRKAHADSRSYWDTPGVYARALAIDWARCCSGRLRRAVLPYKEEQDPAAAEADIARIRAVLEKHKQALYAVFTYYAMSSGGNNTTTWTLNVYTAFCDECRIPDPASAYCKLKDLDNLFIVSTGDVPPEAKRDKGKSSDAPAHRAHADALLVPQRARAHGDGKFKAEADVGGVGARAAHQRARAAVAAAARAR